MYNIVGASLSKHLLCGLHMNRLSLTLKPWAESALAFVSAIYARVLPETAPNRLQQPAIDGRSLATVTNKK